MSAIESSRVTFCHEPHPEEAPDLGKSFPDLLFRNFWSSSLTLRKDGSRLGERPFCAGFSLFSAVGVPDPSIFTIVQRKPGPLRPQGHDLQWQLASSCYVPGRALVDCEGSVGFRECSCSTQGPPAWIHPPCRALGLCLLRLGLWWDPAFHSLPPWVWLHDPSLHSS